MVEMLKLWSERLYWNFIKNRFSFDVIMTSFLFLLLLWEAILLKEKQLCSKGKKTMCKGMRIMLLQTMTQTTAIFLYYYTIYISNIKETHKSCLSKSNLYWCHRRGGVCVLWMLLVCFFKKFVLINTLSRSLMLF